MKLKAWNMNQRSNFNNFGIIPDFVGDEILKDDPDVAVITEFYKVKNWEKTFKERFKEYNIFVTDNPHNEIFLAIKKKYQVVSETYKWQSDYDKNLSDYIDVIIQNKEESLAIIGCRILVDTEAKYNTPEFEKDLRKRYDQFVNITNRIRQLSEKGIAIVGLGDFNTGRRENPNKDWSRTVMESDLNELGIQLYTPEGQSHLGYCCPDHIFASSAIAVNATPYDWKYTEHDLLVYPQGEKTKNIKVGYPDHGIVSATISIT